MLKAKISEIFQSIQGEGPWAGFRQVFVRFYGCHMRCSWCDTPDAIGDHPGPHREMSVKEVFAHIKKMCTDCHSVSLTGGEPLLHVSFLQELIPLLKKLRLPIYLETSGVLTEPLKKIIKDIDMISMDFKLPSSTHQRAFWKEHAAFLTEALKAKRNVFVKIVVTPDTTRQDMLQAIRIMAKANPQLCLILQPDTFQFKKGAMEKCLEYHALCLKKLPHTRLMLQMHKWMNVR